MRQIMERGKQQILYNYLPGNTFDFQGGIISIIAKIRGTQRNDLNKKIVLQRILEDIQGWPDERKYRSSLRNEVLDDPSRFILIEPKEVKANLFPKVFWCTRDSCGNIYDYTTSNSIPSSTCKKCNGHLEQLRFIKIHRCGHIEPLTPPYCGKCKSSNYYSLDTRNSERLMQFRWVCKKCGDAKNLFSGYCNECEWDGDSELKRMEIEPHRARKTYYSHHTVLLNLPTKELDNFLSKSDWEYIIASKYLGLEETQSLSIIDYMSGEQTNQNKSIDHGELEKLLDSFDKGGISKESIVEKIKSMQESDEANDSKLIPDSLQKKSGVDLSIWRDVGKDLIEIILPLERSDYISLYETQNDILNLNKARSSSSNLGFKDVMLLNDFPIVNATYGYTRSEFGPRRGAHDDNIRTKINAFPPEQEYDGKIPIFVDDIQADAIMINLDHNIVIEWLKANGCDIDADLPKGTIDEVSRKAYFVQLLYEASLYETINEENKTLRLVFGLLHTLCHTCLKKAALLSGMQKTSLSEYIIPTTLSFAIYCNHRFGATIGALTSLFEQSLFEWFESIKDSRQCVYDPVCREKEGSCHACTHLAETSCRYFNLNLNRAFLFGGNDIKLGKIEYGFFDFIEMHDK